MSKDKSYTLEVDISDTSTLEHFYVYRSLHSDESWGVVLSISSASKLPNIDFGMHIYAKNEKEAIGRARDIYERVHKFDSSRDNIRRFAAAALKSMVLKMGWGWDTRQEKNIAKATMKVAIALNDEYEKYFNEERK